MILVDKDIKNRQSEIFCDGCYDESCVNAVSYDLHILGIVAQDELADSYVLHPKEVIFVKMEEKIHMPKDLMGRIGEKNSRIRQGLWVSGPHYFPGHETYIYLRVQNITSDTIKVKKGDKLLELDLEYLKANAPSLCSPILCTELEDNQKVRLLASGEIKAGAPLYAIDIYEA